MNPINATSGVAKTGLNAAASVANTALHATSGLGQTPLNNGSGLGQTGLNSTSGLGQTSLNNGSGLGQTGLNAPLGSGINPLNSGFNNAPLGSGMNQPGFGQNLNNPLNSGFNNAPLGSGMNQSGFGQNLNNPLNSGFNNAPLTGAALGTGKHHELGHHQTGLGHHNTEYTTSAPIGGITQAPTVFVEKIEKPVIIKETILPEEKIEIQPVIHRERDQLEVHEVIQPMHERDIASTTVRHATLPAQFQPEMRASDLEFQNQYRSVSSRVVPTVQTEATRREVFSHAPIIEEHINRKVIEEIQPVLYKETVVPVIIQETQPIYERVIEQPTLFEETRSMVDLGTRSVQSTGYSGYSQQYSGGMHPISKETTVIQETFLDGNRISSAPITQTKNII